MSLYQDLQKEKVCELYLQIMEELKKRNVQILTFDKVINSLSKIGEGGFGNVFKGQIDGKDVAIKVANKKIEDHESIQDFLKEIVIFMELRSQHLLRLWGICLDIKNQFCLVSELMKGSLYQALYEYKKYGFKEINNLQKFKIALQIAYGIRDLHHHSNQIIHRDLKLQNILLDEEFNVKIADFGMSRFTGGKSKKRKFNDQMTGTIQYMAPELFQNNEIGAPVDIWAFGCILNEMFTLNSP